MSKLLYTKGNLYSGYPWGVEATREFDTIDLYGPFNSDNEANTFAHQLVEERFAEKRAENGITGSYRSVKVVRIETPQAGRHIVRNKDGAYEYAV